MRKCKFSDPRCDYVGSYEGIAKKLLKKLPKYKSFGSFRYGKFSIGHQSSHRTQVARIVRTFWRIKKIGLSTVILK